MSKRPKIPKKVETQVLVLCARRCCLCYGLYSDDSVKKGQIAHINHDPSNNTLSNLAFLCLNHHEDFDSKTSQTKGITAQEVNFYQHLLFDHIATILRREKENTLDTDADNYSAFLANIRANGIYPSTILRDSEIMQAMQFGILNIEPFAESNLQPTSYECTVGEEALLDNRLISLDNQSPLRLTSKETVVVRSKESIILSHGIMAFLSTGFMFWRRGHALISAGSRVDPGFIGCLTVSITNLGNKPLDIENGSPLLNLEFALLSNPKSSNYYNSR